MKITYTKLVNTVPFKDIPVGGCFIDHEGEICMKVYGTTNTGFAATGFAVCFADKRVYHGNDFSVNVQPVEVELIVHAEER